MHPDQEASDGRPVFVLAPDSFKESLTAGEVCAAMAAGLRVSFPRATYLHRPMADGGEGTMSALVDATGGTVHAIRVTGPLGRPVSAQYGILGDGCTGVVEMASASGLHLIPDSERDPRRTTTYGTGELIRACLDAGVTRLIIGLGGSGTNDAGAGMAQALGVRLLDAQDTALPFGGAALRELRRIDIAGMDPRLAALAIEVASDVINPLCGPQGASVVFGPQKGATPAVAAELDAALATFARVVSGSLAREVADVPGAGAAGGLGAGLLAFTGATVRSGVDLVIEAVSLADAVQQADLVLTGEGRIDGQTRFGKAPLGVSRVARRHGKPVIAIAGSLGDGFESLYGEVFDAIFPVVDRAEPLPDLLRRASANVERTCRDVGAVLRLGGR